MDDRVLLLDGGTGTELRARGVEVPCHIQSIWSARALLDAPEAVRQVHRDYIEAGSDLITLNNYAVTRPLLSRAGLDNRVADLTQIAVDLAHQARDEAGRDVLIAGSLPPLQTSYRPDLIAPPDELLASYRELATLLAGQVDILLCETMASGEEARVAATAALEAHPRVWISWTLQGDRLDTLPSGETLAEAYAQLDGLQAEAILVNCGAANVLTSAVTRLRSLTTAAIGAYANAETIPLTSSTGKLTDAEQRQIQHGQPLNEAGYVSHVSAWLDAGATLVGGCCGTRPSYIAAMHHMIRTRCSPPA